VVGSGIGSNTLFLDPDGGTGRWVCLEPDPEPHDLLVKTLAGTKPLTPYETVCRDSLLTDQQFDTIIYIEVLERIANDREELNLAVSHLWPSGHLIVLSPKHQSPFRRSMLPSVTSGVQSADAAIDFAGSPSTRSNEISGLLWHDLVGRPPTCCRYGNPCRPKQLRSWDHWIVPISRVLDKDVIAQNHTDPFSLGKMPDSAWTSVMPPSPSR
jgi:hypothetical protein